jgi:hypothetical protein
VADLKSQEKLRLSTVDLLIKVVCFVRIIFSILKKLICDLYYKSMTIVNDNSRITNKLEASLTDDARVVIYIYSTSH